ncbi:MAG: cellulase family glycosylhydrolase [Treponema sp.]|jgi:hypothetical protein|nr:cellulase family glycosylhydrolase [Treponema sp.]
MRVKDNLILDDEGRTLILRGVNLGGDSKIPYCAPGSEILPGFLDRKKDVSFTGRPFPIESAEDHFRRLKKAGMTFLRFLVTWEAVEHEGPGIYDEAYLAYLRKILQAAEKEDIRVFIDPHQDVWSRWTGGDGAPAWTMEKLGMDLDMLDRCSAAVTKQRYAVCRDKPYPQMIWPSNYNRYAAATMFSLFFGGKTYTEDLRIDGENVQDWLQNRYIAAFKHVQRRLKNCPNITGWGSMNEPHFGFIGHKDISIAEDAVIPVGIRPSPWQAICAASGYKVEIPVYGLISMGRRISHYETFNTERISLFKEGFSCPWKQAGVWTDEGGAPKLIKSGYFSSYQNRPAVFTDDFLKPFIIKYINAMKEANEQNFFFIEGIPASTRAESHPSWNKNDPERVINAFHWYDGLSLFTKSFHSWFNINPDTKKIIIGKKNVGAYFRNSLALGIKITKEKMGNMPCFLGEFGLPFDLNNRGGFKKGGYSLHEEALSMYYDAVDANLLHCTIWNYSASNSNKYGDGWNDEDLSIFSEGKERAAGGWKRPYPMATAGEPLSFTWNRKLRKFVCRFNANGEITSPSIIYLPSDFLGASPKVEASACNGKNLRSEFRREEQRLFVYNDGYNGEVILKVGLN